MKALKRLMLTLALVMACSPPVFGYSRAASVYCVPNRGVDLSGSFQGAGGIGGMLGLTTHTNTTNYTHYFYHCGAAGNITTLMDTNQVVHCLWLLLLKTVY
jgi:hypothetical protein